MTITTGDNAYFGASGIDCLLVLFCHVSTSELLDLNDPIIVTLATEPHVKPRGTESEINSLKPTDQPPTSTQDKQHPLPLKTSKTFRG